MLDNIIKFFLENRIITILFLIICIAWGIVTAPFNIDKGFLPNDPVSVDAIPDIGENQQIVFTKWNGRSPQDIEDQITYPLTSALLGLPHVRTIRSTSMFGISSIYVIFDDDVEFYWSRSRILEKLNALPANLLPQSVQPTLGPDATALGQIFWYTLEGRNEKGEATGGWDLQELRSIQDFYVKYALSAAEGVSEVASIGGFVKEYQIDVDPDALRVSNISLEQVIAAVRNSNIDVGAKTIEINRAEYFIRSLGYIKSLEDVENTVVASPQNTPIYVKDIAKVSIGPASRRGVLDKSGAEVVGSVVVARYGANPLEVINNVKAKIDEISVGLPSKTLADGTISKLAIVPFYDRTQLIKETVGTLQDALWLEILITIIVIILMLSNFRAALLVSILLPISVLMCFVAMRYAGVDANIVALSGIAIAIGTMVDMGIVMSENIIERLKNGDSNKSSLTLIFEASSEVASAVITAVATTIISFLPVFTMIAAEGKLFKPLAFTKTFALLASVIVSVIAIPTLAYYLFGKHRKIPFFFPVFNILILTASFVLIFYYQLNFIGFSLLIVVFANALVLLKSFLTLDKQKWIVRLQNMIYASIVMLFLAKEWLPLGVHNSLITNFLFIIVLIAILLSFFQIIIHFYANILGFCLRFKWLFMLLPLAMMFSAWNIWKQTGQEFMPSLDEGSFLLMPTSMPHSGMEENIELLKMLDMAVTVIPEVENVVGKLGRVESALDIAPISMFENIINYKSEYVCDENGQRLRFKIDEKGNYLRDESNNLIADNKGKYFRNWREHIHSEDDIWNEIVKVTKLPGLTSAPKLQPIETRLVMLQTGMRAPMGIKVKGPDLESIQAFSLALETALKDVEGVKKEAVFADRIVGKPYLELELKRTALARYGLSIKQLQNYLEVAVGGITLTQTVEGRERYPVRVRYPRELRDTPDAINNILINTPSGAEIPLSEVANLTYRQGPQAIKSEDGFLIGYVLFDKLNGFAELDVVENAQEHLQKMIDTKQLEMPNSVSYRFAGNYENQVRATKRLGIVIPLALALIFLILYFQFRSVAVASMVFSGVFVAFSGGFIMIWLYGQTWFLNFEIFNINLREMLHIQPINISVAVWVGFLALFGIATDDGVLVATYLKQSFEKQQPQSIKEIRQTVILAGLRRVRPAMMTTATTILALLPILTSTGRGADIMIPMAIPSFGGMIIQMITMFTVPVLYCWWHEIQFFFDKKFKK